MYTGGSSSSSSSKLIQHQQQHQQQQQQNSPSLNEYQAAAAAAAVTQVTAMNNANMPINYIQSTQALNMKMLQSMSHSSMMNAHPSTLSSSTSLNQIATSGTAQMVAVSAQGYYMNPQPKMYNSMNNSQYNAHHIAHHSLLGPVPINDMLSHPQNISKANSYPSMQMQANSQTLPSIYATSSYNYVPNSNIPPTQSAQITHQSQSSLITLTDSTNPNKRASETNSSMQSKVNTNAYANAPSQSAKLSHLFSNHRSKTIINKSRYYLNNKVKHSQQTNGANSSSPTGNLSNESANSNQKSQKLADSASSDAYLSKLKNCIDANRRNINQRLYLNTNTSQNSSDMNTNYSNRTANNEHNETKSNQKSSNQQYHYQPNKPLIVIKPADNIDEEVLPKKLKRETTENSNSSDQKGEDLQAQKKLCKLEQVSIHKPASPTNNKSSENGAFVVELNGTLYETNTPEAQKQTDLNNNQLFSLKVNMFYCKACSKLLHDQNCVKEHMSSIHNVK